jgi:hypothetical protein
MRRAAHYENVIAVTPCLIYNSVTPAILAAHYLSLSNSSNLTLLNSQIGEGGRVLFAVSNYSVSATLTNALRPFPHGPTGNSWYDSL